MSKVEESVYNAINPVINDLGFSIYDVEYLKEGANWYLRIYIDKEEGRSIEDCETVSRAIDPIIDELNPIKTQYSLEVSSPGIERNLRKSEHFNKYKDTEIEVSLFKPIDGAKKIKCILKDYNGEKISVNYQNNDIDIELKDISVVKTVYNF